MSPRRRRPPALFVEAILAGLLAVVFYYSNGAAVAPPDQRAHVYLSWSLVFEGDAELGEYADLGYPAEFHEHTVGDRVYAPYLPGNAVLFAPFALVARALGYEDPIPWEVAGFMPRLLTSLAVGTALVATHLVVAQRAGRIAALFVTFAVAFGTTMASVASQVLYEHGTTVALVAVAMAISLSGSRAPLAGLPLGLALLVRPTNIFAAAAIVAALAQGRPSAAVRAILWMLPAMAFLALFNWLTFGSPLRMSRPLPGLDPLGGGVIGLLVAPSRGLLVYSPFLLAALAAFVAAWRWKPEQRTLLLRYGGIAFVLTLLTFGLYEDWWGGSQYGDRYLSDLMPFYGLALGEAFARGWLSGSVRRAVFALAVGFGVLTHVLGMAMSYVPWQGVVWRGREHPALLWGGPPVHIDDTPYRLWLWAEPEWVFYLVRYANELNVQMTTVMVALLLCTAAFVTLSRRASAASAKVLA